MKTRPVPTGGDRIGAGHLTAVTHPTPPVRRVEVPPDVAALVRWAWIPVWDLPPGEVLVQRVLQAPVCQLVVGHQYARLWGVGTGMNTVELSGRGWVVGLALQPAAGRLLLGADVATITDGWLDLAQLPAPRAVDWPATVAALRAQMSTVPQARSAQDLAVDLLVEAIRGLLPVGDGDRFVNELVSLVERDRSILRVADLADRVAMSPRHLQRLTRERLGLTPKWLIQRRRLHEASQALQRGAHNLAAVALDLGYTDQAHFSADWKRVTGMTPAAYRADQPHG